MVDSDAQLLRFFDEVVAKMQELTDGLSVRVVWPENGGDPFVPLIDPELENHVDNVMTLGRKRTLRERFPSMTPEQRLSKYHVKYIAAQRNASKVAIDLDEEHAQLVGDLDRSITSGDAAIARLAEMHVSLKDVDAPKLNQGIADLIKGVQEARRNLDDAKVRELSVASKATQFIWRAFVSVLREDVPKRTAWTVQNSVTPWVVNMNHVVTRDSAFLAANLPLTPEMLRDAKQNPIQVPGLGIITSTQSLDGLRNLHAMALGRVTAITSDKGETATTFRDEEAPYETAAKLLRIAHTILSEIIKIPSTEMSPAVSNFVRDVVRNILAFEYLRQLEKTMNAPVLGPYAFFGGEVQIQRQWMAQRLENVTFTRKWFTGQFKGDVFEAFRTAVRDAVGARWDAEINS